MIIDDSEADYALMVWDTDVQQHQPQLKPSAPARLLLTFGSRYYETLVESLPLRVCKALPLQDLQTLSITHPEAPWSIADWVDVSIHCPKVTHLHVGDGWALTLVSTLLEHNAFPSLDTLTVQDVNVRIYLSREYAVPLGLGLLTILRARSNAGIPVRHLNLRSCPGRGWLRSLLDESGVPLNFDQGHDSDSQPSSAYDPDFDSWSDGLDEY
jgi:hypothetical protein